MIAATDRYLAGIAFLCGISVTLGSKSAIVVVLVLAVVSSAYAFATRLPLQFPRLGINGWSALLSWLAFAFFAGLSSLWSLAPAASLSAGANLVVLITAIAVLMVLWGSLSPAVSTLLGGWFAIGIAIGITVLLVDVATSNTVVTWLLRYFDVTGKGAISMTQRLDGHVIGVAPDILNWSIAGMNILVWPSLLLIATLADGKWGALLSAGLVTIAVVTTIGSQHETSILALIVGLILFVLARLSARVAIRLLATGVVAATMLVLPLMQYAHDGLALHRAPSIPPSLQHRFIIWNKTAEHVALQRWNGIGANATKTWSAAMAKSLEVPNEWPAVSSHAHNYFLQVWFELGFAGALLLCCAAVASVLTIGRLSPPARPYAAATAAVSITMCSATWSVWHMWLPAVIGLAGCVLALASRLVLARQNGMEVPGFSSIALPRRV